MECSHNSDDVRLYIHFFKKQYKEVDEKLWGVYETLAKSQMVGAPILIGKTVLRNNGLSSGYPGTADLNCIKMSMIVSCLVAIRNRAFGEITLVAEDWAKVELAYAQAPHRLRKMLSTDYNWIRGFQEGDLGPLFSMQGVTMRSELHNQDVLGTLSREHYSPLDFLGFDIAHFTPAYAQGIKYVYPALAKERLYKAMVFNKSEVGLDLSKPQDLAQSYVVTMAKCQSLYLMGGFLDKTASPLLNATYLRAWAALKRMGNADLS